MATALNTLSSGRRYNRGMPIFFQHRRLASLLVFMAILFNACAPAIGQAVTTLVADPLALEVCRAATGRDGQEAPAKLPPHLAKHCVVCAFHAGSEAPPPPSAGLLTVLEGHNDYPLPHRAAPVPAGFRPAAQPRGPPAA
jgi:hypothetical protein